MCFVGFTPDEEKHMTDVLLANGGTLSALEDSSCTHIVSIFEYFLSYNFNC